MLQYVVAYCGAVRCSALQYVAVRCSTLQYLAVRCSTLQLAMTQLTAVRCSTLQFITVRCSMSQLVMRQLAAIRCSTSHCVAVHCSALQQVAVSETPTDTPSSLTLASQYINNFRSLPPPHSHILQFACAHTCTPLYLSKAVGFYWGRTRHK